MAALERIEKALARIEAVAERPTRLAGDGEELAALRGRHATLRQRVEGAIREIDRMLEPERH